LIGEGIARLRALTDTKQRTTLLGMAWWGNVTEKTRTMVLELQRSVWDSIIMIITKGKLFLKDSVTSHQEAIRTNIPFHFDDKDIHSLEKNHTHFLLLDDGKYCSQETRKEDLSSNQQAEFMKTINYPKEIQRSDFVTHACYKKKCEFEMKMLYSSHCISSYRLRGYCCG
jgi:hypothetical protein